MVHFDPMASEDNDPIVPVVVATPPVAPELPVQASSDPDSIKYPWDTPQHNYHNSRVLCDQAGLTLEEKNTICACLYQESRFDNGATHANVLNGKVVSTDWGIAQVNDYYHIGVGKDFSTVVYVVDNPDKVIAWMIGMYQHGLLKQWVSFSSGAYLQWLSTDSPMWGLATSVS